MREGEQVATRNYEDVWAGMAQIAARQQAQVAHAAATLEAASRFWNRDGTWESTELELRVAAAAPAPEPVPAVAPIQRGSPLARSPNVEFERYLSQSKELSRYEESYARRGEKWDSSQNWEWMYGKEATKKLALSFDKLIHEDAHLASRELMEQGLPMPRPADGWPGGDPRPLEDFFDADDDGWMDDDADDDDHALDA